MKTKKKRTKKTYVFQVDPLNVPIKRTYSISVEKLHIMEKKKEVVP